MSNLPRQPKRAISIRPKHSVDVDPVPWGIIIGGVVLVCIVLGAIAIGIIMTITS